MPLREFYCASCDQVFEELVRSSKKTGSAACPTCGSRRVSRRISVFSARSGGHQPLTSTDGRACPRCGDPDGPCGM